MNSKEKNNTSNDKFSKADKKTKERIENFIIMLPVLAVALGIIVMMIIYSIFY